MIGLLSVGLFLVAVLNGLAIWFVLRSLDCLSDRLDLTDSIQNFILKVLDKEDIVKDDDSI